MILIDLQKAFDTINHSVLLDKMKILGFSNESVLWFRSYLANRTFCVAIGKIISKPGSINCGVPQGSILGPLLFLLYVNDMKQSVKCDLILYADDSCLIYQHETVNVIEKVLNSDFSSLCDWFVDNKLSIYFGVDKTKSILFAPKRKIKNVDALNITYKDIQIKQHSHVKYLGCILDQCLSGELMALHVINKINGKLRYLYRKNSFLTGPLRRLLCNALIQPHFDYAPTSWFPNLNKNLTKKLQVCQNKCIRFCLQKGNRSHIGSKEFEEINWMPVQDRFNQCVASQIYKFFNKLCPAYMSEIYQPVGSTGVRTRTSFLKLQQPSRKTTQGQRSLSFMGPSIWNAIPGHMKEANSVNCFKHSLKRHFFNALKKDEKNIFMY
jgi:hypothetical protein